MKKGKIFPYSFFLKQIFPSSEVESRSSACAKTATQEKSNPVLRPQLQNPGSTAAAG